MNTVLLLGELGKKFGRTHHFKINSPAEAIRALSANFPGFEKHLLESKKNNVGYKVVVGKYGLRDDRELRNPSGQNQIIIAPVIAGSGAVFRIFVGAVLIVAGALLTPYLGPAVGGAMIGAGIGLVLGGVVQLLTPIPRAGDPSERPENKPSYFFNGPVNTTAQGQPCPVGYGTMIVGGAVISGGISTEEIPVDS